MSEQPEPEQPQPSPESVTVDASSRLWARLRDHKVIQWGVAYLGAALAIAQGEQVIGDVFGWSTGTGRAVVVVLMIGLPVALTIAWYHGHRGLKSVSAGELWIVSVLMLIGGLLFTVTMRPGGARSPDEAPTTSTAEQRDGRSSGVGPGEAPAPQGVRPNSVAVLPCVNQSPDPNDAYIANGIHGEIIEQLDKLQNLTVLPRRAVVRYSDSPLTIPEIAAELRVEAIVDCTVRYANDRVRISAELISPTSERLWSDVYERSFDDLFAIQADIAMNITNGIGAEYSAAEQAELERPATTSLEAYRLYLQSRTLIATQSPDAIRQALLLNDRALQLDPDFALARGAKVATQVFSLVDGTANRPYAFQAPSAEREARAEIERVIARDPSLIHTVAAKATLDFYAWHWTEALRQYRAIAEALITSETALLQYAFLTAYTGNADEGIRFAERLVQVDPEAGSQILGVMQGYAHDFDAAVANLHKAQNLLPLNPLVSNWIGYMEIARGNEAEAVARLEYSRRILEDQVSIAFWPEFAYAYHRLGRQAEAQRFYDDIVRVSALRSIGAGTWALASLAIGDEDKALEWLGVVATKAANHEIDEGLIAVMNLKMNFTNDPLLKEPRFAEVLSRIRGD